MTALPGKVVMASGNPGKLREIQRILGDFDIDIVPQSELGVSDADETGSTFVENALIKARHASRRAPQMSLPWGILFSRQFLRCVFPILHSSQTRSSTESPGYRP